MLSSVAKYASKQASAPVCKILTSSLSRKATLSSHSVLFTKSVVPSSRYFHTSRALRAENEETSEEVDDIEKDLPIPTEPLPLDKLQQIVETLNESKRQVSKSNKEVKELQTKLMHSYAERENIRRVAQKDVENAKEFGIKSFAIKMIDVIDTVEICLQNTPKNMENNQELEGAFNALQATKNNFLKVMADYDVVQADVKLGDKFDANLHHATIVWPASTPEQANDTIAAILKSCWTRKGNLLRAAQVAVWKKN